MPQGTRKHVIVLASLFLSGSFIFIYIFSRVQGRESGDSTRSFEIYLPLVRRHSSDWWQENWAMVAANPQRTSYVPNSASNQTEIHGDLRPLWYRPISPYINYKTQVIAANDLLYISTARGLYAIYTGDRAGTTAGDLAWVYPTELPLGNSPTVLGDVLYVGGFDKQMHAIRANPEPSGLPIDQTTGYHINNQVLWTFEAEAGFEANPLVVNNTVYAGNRDGYFYAIDATNGTLRWRYQTGGTILQSAAYHDSTIYLVSNDMHAYALNATTGALVWKSGKLGGNGFYSYWPVLYHNVSENIDWVIFVGSSHYYHNETYQTDTWNDIGTPFYLHGDTNAGSPGGLTDIGGGIYDANPLLQYREAMPWRRTYFPLNRLTGQEVTVDLDNDGQPEYSPITYTGAKGGMRYPPIVVPDRLYQNMPYRSPNQGTVVRWPVFETAAPFRYIAPIGGQNAADEPLGYSAGGNVVYWGLTVDRTGGGTSLETGQIWSYWSYNLSSLIPGYNVRYCGGLPPPDTGDYAAVFDNRTNGVCNYTGIYSQHGVINPLIPYKGRLYVLRGNSIIALSPTSGTPTPLSMLSTVNVQNAPARMTTELLRQKLETEVQEMVSAGHLLPGYQIAGTWNEKTNPRECVYYPGEGCIGEYLAHYFSNPADTLYTLIRALPHLSSDLQQQTRAYLQQEFTDYPPYNTAHIGWQTGTPRQAFDPPPEMRTRMSNFPPRPDSRSDGGTFEPWYWSFPQYSFYGLWMYAREFPTQANNIFSQIQGRIETPPADSVLVGEPAFHNAYIAGYIGFCKLEELVNTGSNTPGMPANCSRQSTLNGLLSLRVSKFSQSSGWTGTDYRRHMNVARNFMYLVPELSEYLRTNALSQVQAALDEYNDVAPGWFVSFYDATFGEGYFDHLYTLSSLFQARAQILQQPREELVKYLDVPAFERGDLFYIQNLIATIEAPSNGTSPSIPTPILAPTSTSTRRPPGFENFINRSGNRLRDDS